jgi:hypothetical protein
MSYLTFIFDTKRIGPHLGQAPAHILLDTLGGGQYAYQRHDTKNDDEQCKSCPQLIAQDRSHSQFYILCEIHRFTKVDVF